MTAKTTTQKNMTKGQTKNKKNTRQYTCPHTTNWNIPQPYSYEQHSHEQLCSYQKVQNLPRVNGCEIEPLSAGVVRIHYLLEAIHSTQIKETYSETISNYENNSKGCWFGFINGTGYISFRTIYKPTQRTLNSIEREIIDISKENMNTTVVKPPKMNLNRIKPSTYFRSTKMTAKLKADLKAAQAGPAAGGQPSGPGASTTPPPPVKPSKEGPAKQWEARQTFC